MKINSDGSFVIISTDYELPYNPFKPEVSCITTLQGHFKNLSPSSVTLRKVNGFILIDIQCSNSTDCIKFSQVKKCGFSYDTEGLTFGAFDDKEDNIGARLKKAFIHLITLYGGKKEVF